MFFPFFTHGSPRTVPVVHRKAPVVDRTAPVRIGDLVWDCGFSPAVLLARRIAAAFFASSVRVEVGGSGVAGEVSH